MTDNFSEYRRTPGMRAWELAHGRDLRQAIVEEVAATGSLKAAARAMKLPFHTVRTWCIILGIQRSRTTTLIMPGGRGGEDTGDTTLLEAVG